MVAMHREARNLDTCENLIGLFLNLDSTRIEQLNLRTYRTIWEFSVLVFGGSGGVCVCAWVLFFGGICD